MKSPVGYLIEESGDELNDETFGDLDEAVVGQADFDFSGRALQMPSPSASPSTSTCGRRGLTADQLEMQLLASKAQAPPITVPSGPKRSLFMNVSDLENSFRSSASISMDSSPLSQGGSFPVGFNRLGSNDRFSNSPMRTVSSNERPMSPPPGFVSGPRLSKLASKPAPVITFPREDDPNALLMSKYEREGIRHIHMAQLTTENPMLEDFYYQAFSKRSLKNQQNQSNTPLYLPLPNLKKKPANKEKMQHYEGALGKIAGSSSRKPRQQLQFDVSKPHQTMELDQEDISTEELYFSVLGCVEKIYGAIFNLEDVLSHVEDEEYDSEKAEQIKSSSKDAIMSSLKLGSQHQWGRAEVLRFVHILGTAKGRKVIFRALRLLDSTFASAFLTRLLENIEYLDVFRPNTKATEIESFVNLVLSPLVLFVSEAPARLVVNAVKTLLQKPSSLWLLFSRPGVILMCILVSRIEICKSSLGGDIESDPILGSEWIPLAKSVFEQVSDRLMDFFNVPSLKSTAHKGTFDGGDYYIWQFLALLALNVDAEDRKIMVVELREKILSVAQHGQPKDITHLNIFLNVLGLDSRLSSMTTKSYSLTGWTVSSTNGPIATLKESEEITSKLGFPHPTMLFPRNSLKVQRGDFSLEINALNAVYSVVNKSPEDIKVVYSQQKFWQEKKGQFKQDLDYDWTYQSQHAGSIQKAEEIKTDQTINYDRLKISDASEVLFYDENVLFEDELGDNGTSVFSVKTRVMRYGIFILVRSFIRVDEVTCRSFDTRYFIDVETGTFLKESRVRQDAFSNVVSRLGRDFRDANVAAEILPQVSCSTTLIRLI